MATLQKKLEELIARHLQDGTSDLTTLPNGRVSGHVISRDFDQRNYEARRDILRQLWGRHLLPEETLQIGTLLTYTPEEWQVPLVADD